MEVLLLYKTTVPADKKSDRFSYRPLFYLFSSLM
nr:MAG TPA: hypothetical protein [Caudoviricetes sp.]